MNRYARLQAGLGCRCGFVARSALSEARHRHNFPLLCKGHKPAKAERLETEETGDGPGD
jgi:hypothetical protein